MSAKLLQFVNCRILRNHKIQEEDLWVRYGKIVNPEKVFFDERVKSDIRIDCKQAIIAPGLIDLQINGGFGYDFSCNLDQLELGVMSVAKGILPHGVTAFCPTIVTSPKEYYSTILNKVNKRKGDKNGATILGLHLEGPFISRGKKGAHPEKYIKNFDEGFFTVEQFYPKMKNISIVTLAPELESAHDVIYELYSKGIVVSLGHSMADLNCGEKAVRNGASFITHLFNAMLPVSFVFKYVTFLLHFVILVSSQGSWFSWVVNF